MAALSDNKLLEEQFKKMADKLDLKNLLSGATTLDEDFFEDWDKCKNSN